MEARDEDKRGKQEVYGSGQGRQPEDAEDKVRWRQIKRCVEPRKEADERRIIPFRCLGNSFLCNAKPQTTCLLLMYSFSPYNALLPQSHLFSGIIHIIFPFNFTFLFSLSLIFHPPLLIFPSPSLHCRHHLITPLLPRLLTLYFPR